MTLLRWPVAAIVAASCASVAVPSARAAELRGTLTGYNNLQPAPAPEVRGRRLFYWEEPTSAIVARRANPEHDLGVVLTGAGLPEASRPVDLRVEGGRCRPGTVVVAPNSTLTLQNLDWFQREFYATRQGSDEALTSAQPTPTAPRSQRHVQFPAAGVYELRDRAQPLFRCWVVVEANRQGRVLPVNPQGAFRLTGLPAGAYDLRVYFEGRVVGERLGVALEGDRTVNVPAIALSAAGAQAPAAGAQQGAAGQQPGAENPAGAAGGEQGAGAPAANGAQAGADAGAPADEERTTRRRRRRGR